MTLTKDKMKPFKKSLQGKNFLLKNSVKTEYVNKCVNCGCQITKHKQGKVSLICINEVYNQDYGFVICGCTEPKKELVRL